MGRVSMTIMANRNNNTLDRVHVYGFNIKESDFSRFFEIVEAYISMVDFNYNVTAEFLPKEGV